MSKSLAVVLGGAAAGIALVVIAIAVLLYYFLHCKNVSNRNSESASSDPTLSVEWNGGTRVSSTVSFPLTESQGARVFTLEELEAATKRFSDCNLVGQGGFGAVYKGLLSDGTVVAIKRRVGEPRKEFIDEVQHLSEISHRNLVTLFGYCQEGGLQMLVFEYVPNGSVSRHLYDAAQGCATKLEFKQRLSIAIGAAKGLRHLHGLVPPFVHKDFRTTNVLVDENFIAKVANVGITYLLSRVEDANSSTSSTSNIFQDPEVEEHRRLSTMSDVYSFGVFLLELVAGREAKQLHVLEAGKISADQVETCLSSEELIDRRLGNSFTSEGMNELLGLTLKCLNLQGRKRPKMESVVLELDRILETEMALTTVMGDGTAIVTLGSQLFSSS